MRPPRTELGLALLLGLGLPALAQTPPASSLRLSASANLLVSDNLDPNAGYRDKGAVLQLAPGLVWRSSSGVLQGSADYSLGLLRYLKSNTAHRSLQHQLRGNARLGAPELPLSLDAQAQIGQQAASAFAAQSLPGSRPGSRSNQTEVGTASLTPALRLGQGRPLQLSLAHTATEQRTRDSERGDLRAANSVAALSLNPGATLGGTLQLTRTQSRPRGERELLSERAQLQASWRPDVDWSLQLSGGHERSNARGGATQEGANYGAGLGWQPGPRTQAALDWQHRLLGDTYAATLSHRFARSAMRLGLTRSLNDPGAVGNSGARTYYELLFATFASVEPDPIKRDELVRLILQRQGLSPDALATAGFLTGAASLTRSAQLGWTWQGLRSTWALNLNDARTERLSTPQNPGDDLANTGLLRQRGASLSASYRLTPLSGLALVLNWQRTLGQSAEQASTLRGASLSWTTRLGPQRQLALTLRHADYAALRQPYQENAVQASLTQQF